MITKIPPAGLEDVIAAGSKGSASQIPIVEVNSKGQVVSLGSAALDLSTKLDKTGGSLTGDLAGTTFKSSRTSENARDTGFQFSTGADIGEGNRSTQYYDDRASNCNGYLPNGNCAGNGTWNPPNGNWWTWGVAGVPGGNCGNPSGFDFAGGQSNTLYPVSVSFNYDGYYEAANEIGGSEQRRNYRNCNCGNCIGNCYTNCNCNCDCACNCNCCAGG